jgi:cytochrome c
MEEQMKVAVLLTVIFLLSLVIGCTQRTQPPPNTQQGNQAQTQSPPSGAKSERGTPAEAKAMLQQAVGHYQEVGRKQALADFTGKKPPFVDRDLYVACIGPDHTIIANGGFPYLVGSSVDAWKDADGKPLGRTSFEVASSKGEGSVAYRWYNPVSGKLEPKILFVQKIGDDVCGVGAYNPQ